MGMNTNYDKGGADSIQPLQPPTTQKAGKQAPIGQVEKKITNVADKLNSLESPPSKLDTKIKTIAEQVKSVMALKKQYSQLASPEDKHAFLMKALAGTKDENYAVLSILLDEEKDSKQYQGAGHRLKELCDESGQNFVQLSSALLEVKKFHDMEEKMSSEMQTTKKNHFPNIDKKFFE